MLANRKIHCPGDVASFPRGLGPRPGTESGGGGKSWAVAKPLGPLALPGKIPDRRVPFIVYGAGPLEGLSR